MVSFIEQVLILLWKNYTLRKRSITRLVMEIVWPLLLFVILWWVRTRGFKYKENSCHLVEKALPSVGGLEFVQNFVCTLNNTCYDDYVENTDSGRWDDAVLVKFIKDTTPILNSIVSNEESRATITQLSSDIMDIMKVVSTLQNIEDVRSIGQLQFKDFLHQEGKDKFLTDLQTYAGLSAEDADDLLNVGVNLSKLQKETLSSFVETLKTEDCTSSSTFEFLSFPSPSSQEKFCKLGQEKMMLVLFLYTNYLDRGGLINRLNTLASMENAVQGIEPSANRVPGAVKYDLKTLGLLSQLGRKASEAGKQFGDFSNMTMGESVSIIAYQGFCGYKPKTRGNDTMFGIDPGLANRFDSLRDQLRDIWKSDKYYESDPDISPACNAIFQRLEAMPLTSFIWKQIKPMLRGYIYYAPETDVTRALMEKVEDMFSEIQDLEYVINSVRQFLHRIRLFTHKHLDEINKLKAFLSNQSNVDGVLNSLGVSLSAQESDRVAELSRIMTNTSIEDSLESMDFVLELLNELGGCIRYRKTKGFNTEWEAVDAGYELLTSEKLWAVVVFLNVPEEKNVTNETITDSSNFPAHIYYKIRMDSDKVDGTRDARDKLSRKGHRRRPFFDLKYFTFGFIYLQEMIERSIIELVTGKDLSEEQVFMQQNPYPCYIIDQFIRRISRTFPLFMVLSWVYASAMIIKSIVLEKERRLREVMKIMGVCNSAVWTSWFLESFSVMVVSSTLLALILKFGKILENSDLSLIWVFLISYTVATICFSFLISTLFSHANSAAAAGGVIFFISYLPFNMMLIWEDQLKWFEILSGCLISNVAFGFGCTYYARYEQDGIGAQWNNLSWQNSSTEDDFNLLYCILMMWADSVLYLILMWYIEAVHPGEFGVPKPWYFFVQKSYWCPPKVAHIEEVHNIQNRTLSGDSRSSSSTRDLPQPEGLEAEPDGVECGVRVLNLCKTYPNGKVAVENLSVNFYQDQITSFLGHNGAGKTTTISILTGLFPPTRGTAIINGLDIRTQMDSIRRNLGICPQFNVLFDRLNVYEHLVFYALLKGRRGKEVEKEFDDMLIDLGIPHKRYCYPSALSGGMKRKLSVAIAFIGGSKTVFLDEPTSGVDPYSRRSIWELLLKYKKGRTVILTTHFMDEADILGDRIAIISQGKLKALGSSLYLKTNFGQGYTLHVVKRDKFISACESIEINSEPSQKQSYKHSRLIEKFVRDLIPEAMMMEYVGSEVSFLLPYPTLNKFSGLFAELEKNMESLGILSYGISDTSLEDVFLKITMADLMQNAESFHALSSVCKRKIMNMINTCKNRLSKKPNTVDTRVLPTTNSTALSVKSIVSHEADYIKNTDVDGETMYSDRSTVNASILEGKSIDASEGSCAALEVEAVTSSLLDMPYECTNPVPNRSCLSKRNRRSCCMPCVQIYMIILKRLWNSRRNIKAVFFEIVLPALFIAITLAFTLILPPATDEPPREITPWAYQSPNTIYFSEPKRTRRTGSPVEFKNVLQELMGPVGMGTACVVDDDGHSSQFCYPTKWQMSTVEAFNSSRLRFNGTKFAACSCAVGSQQCPKSVNQVSFPTLKTQTGDFLLDVSGTNIAEWILKTYEKNLANRYGGYELLIRNPTAVSLMNYLALLNNITNLVPLPLPILDRHGHEKVLDPPQFTPAKNTHVYKVWFENRGWLSSVAYLNGLHNMWLREKLPEQYQSNKSQFGITLINHPMNLTKSQTKQESLKVAGLGVIHAICIIFALSFIPASFTVYLIQERKCGGKHLHLVSGVPPVIYWIANYMFDTAKYFVPIALCLVLFKLFDARAYIGAASIWSFICLLLLYGWASIPSMYPFSFLFSVPSTAFVVLACTNLFLGVITTVSTFVLEQFGDADLEAIGKVLEKVFLVFPQYCLGRGCIELVKLHTIEIGFSEMTGSNSTKTTDRFEWDHLGEKLTFLSLHGIVYFLLNLALEYKNVILLLCKFATVKKIILGSSEEDEDVVDERQRVSNAKHDEMTLSAFNLTKIYRGKKHPAVKSITFGISKGECFGLLGVNGAGKSSTFKMLTGDARISSGAARICTEDVETSLDKARKHFGYCPQEDSIDPLLTGYELLMLYGRLRGLSYHDTKLAAERLIKILGLSRYANRSSGTYSGGNKRKLSTAIALIGDPDVLFLDEPTSGMDPGARRDLWKVILDLLQDGKTVVLTSHSMEECEVLCTKIAIMVNGEFKCLGSLQHLKNRFGKGYTLTIRCSSKSYEDVLKRISADLPMATVEDQHCLQLTFNIPQESAQLSTIFSTLIAYKNELIIEDYSVSQTTLDDIFVKFASTQTDSLDR